MAAPTELDVVLDADGKSVYTAFEYINRELARVQKSVRDIQKDSYKSGEDFRKSLTQAVKDLQAAQGQMRTLSGPGTAFGDYDKALKSARDQSKAHFRQEETARKESLRTQVADETAAARQITDVNAAADRARAESRKLATAARLEATRAEIAANARMITSDTELAAAQRKNQEDLRRFRAAARTETDPAQQRALATLIGLERDRAKALEQTARSINRVTTAREKDFVAAQKASDASNRASTKVYTQMDRAFSSNSKGGPTPAQVRAQTDAMWAAYDKANAPSTGTMSQAERAGEGIVSRMNMAGIDQETKQLQSLRTLRAAAAREDQAQTTATRAAKLDAARAEAVNNARSITSLSELALARQKNVEMLARLRAAQTTETDPRQLAAIAELVKIERARADAIRQTNRELERQGIEQQRAKRTELSSRVGTAVKNTALYGIVAGLGFGAYNAIQESISNIVELEDEFAKLQAISDSTDGQMQGLKATIYGIGEGSRFAVNDLVKIAQTLAQAGVSASQMGKVLNSVTTLATASGSTPDEAVQLVTSALGSFQLQASEAARVADLMTSALNRTKLTVGQVAQAIQYVGATAYEQNISLETLLATVGAVAQGGVRSGSTIGTGFRQFLVDLQTPSEKLQGQLERLGITQADVNVKTRGLAAVLETLKEKGFGATQAYDGLETRAAAFYLVAKNNTDIMDELQLSFAQSGAAAIANERAMNSLTAQWQRFKNVVQENLSDFLDQPMRDLQDFLRTVTDSMVKSRAQLAEAAVRRSQGVNGYEGDRAEKALQYAMNYDLGAWLQKGIDKNAEFFLGIERGAASSSAAMQVYGTAIKESTEKVDEHSQTITELDKELDRLNVQQKDLIGNQKRSQAETVNLTARFGGLVSYLGTTKNAYLDLIQAMGQYRGEESRLLATAYAGQVGAQQKQNNLDQRALNGALSQIRNDRNAMSQFTPTMQAFLSRPDAAERIGRSDPNDREASNAAAALARAAEKVKNSNVDLGNVLNDAATFAGRLAVGVRGARRGTEMAGQAAAAGTVLGIQTTSYISSRQARLDALSTQEPGERTRNGNALITNIKEGIAQLEAKAKGVREGANRTFIADSITTLRNMLSQVSAAIKPSVGEIKEAKAAAREKAQADREASKSPKVTQSDIDSVGQALGLALGSGTRTPAEQEHLHAIGATEARGYGPRTSNHVSGVARDFSVRGLNDRQAEEKADIMRARYKAAGIEVQVKYERGGKNDGTGRHIHVGARAGARKRNDETGTIEDQYDASLDQAQVDLQQQELKNALKEVGLTTTKETFDAAVKRSQDAVAALNKSLTSAARSELTTKGFDPDGNSPQAKARMSQLAQAIQQNMDEVQQKIGDSIIKSIGLQVKAAERAFDAAVQPAKAAQALADARVTGFGYTSNQNMIPDYVKAGAERAAGLARENVDRSTLANLPGRISRQEALITATQNDPLLDTDRKTAQVDELTAALNNLKAQRDALAAAFSASGLVPTTIGDGLNAAVQQYQQANDLTKSFKDTVIMNLGGAIEQVHGSLTDMFSSIFTGSQTALGAFANFAKGIGNYLAQLAAKFVASQILNLIFKLAGVGISAAGSNLSGDLGSADRVDVGGGLSVVPFAPQFTGGPAGFPVLKRATGGGLVANGDDMRDSVYAKLAKDEYVVRGAAVDSVGTQFMANLNAHGAKALTSQQQAVKPMALPKQQMGVYIVAPEQMPSLSPQDVLVTLQNDILQGGETKKLIKFVQQGG